MKEKCFLGKLNIDTMKNMMLAFTVQNEEHTVLDSLWTKVFITSFDNAMNSVLRDIPIIYLLLPLHFNGHFPGEPGLAGVYWSKGW